MPTQWLMPVYFLIVNVLGAALILIDKRKARLDRWRIRERVFFIFAFAGGGIGELTAMFLVRHKTRHRSFTFGIPVITLLFYGFLLFLFLR